MKLHHLRPRRGEEGTDPRGSRARGRPWQDRRARHQGHGCPRQDARGLRGRPDALIRRVPKLKGFSNPNRVEYAPVNVEVLATYFDDEVTPEALYRHGLAHKGAKVKVLARGELDKKLTVKAHAFSRRPRRRSRPPAGPPRSSLSVSYLRKPCSRRSSTRSGSRTSARRSSSRWGSSPSSGSGPTPARRGHRDPPAGARTPGRGRLPRHHQPVLGRRLIPTRRVLARDHALHHELDHHAADDRGDPQAPAVAGARGGRDEEDQPVDPLRDGRARAAAVDGPGVPVPQPERIRHPDVFPPGTFTGPNVAFIVLIMTAGTALIMWLGELITQRGVGNGMSILIFTSVISTLPFEGRVDPGAGRPGQVHRDPADRVRDHRGRDLRGSGPAPRADPVRQARRRPQDDVRRQHVPPAEGQPGRRDPIIFATSVLYFPALLASVYHAEWFQNFVTNYVQNTRSIVYMALLAMLIIFFSYFYTAIQFDPTTGRQPPQERRVHPRHPSRASHGRLPEPDPDPDRPAGCDLPRGDRADPHDRLRGLGLAQFPFGGTSILIAVGVALETMKIESQ